jgi:hypothetical protein
MSEDRVTKLRKVVLEDLAFARESFERALQHDQHNVFTWHREQFWVDQVRRFVVPRASSLRFKEGFWERTSLPRSEDEATELLEIYGGEYQLEDTGSILKMWSELIAGLEASAFWDLVGAKMINLAIAQPLVNPAFGPLLWLAFADDMGRIGDYSPNFFKLVGPMMYQLIDYPELTPPPVEVRAAQMQFLERMFPGSTDASCELLSNTEWAARCEAQLQQHQKLVDDRFFDPLLERIGALDHPDARPFV